MNLAVFAEQEFSFHMWPACARLAAFVNRSFTTESRNRFNPMTSPKHMLRTVLIDRSVGASTAEHAHRQLARDAFPSSSFDRHRRLIWRSKDRVVKKGEAAARWC
jgi:hypothetical protein